MSSIMADTDKTDEWIKRAVAAYPPKILPSGEIRTCPLRIQFVHLEQRGKPQPNKTEGDFGCALIVPVGADISTMKKAVKDFTMTKFPDAGQKGAKKIKGPWKKVRESFLDDDGDEIDDPIRNYDGFMVGAEYFNATAKKYQPSVLGPDGKELKDKTRVYAGCWVIAVLNPFSYEGTNTGVSLGLQAVQWVADDRKFGTDASDHTNKFEKVSLDASISTDSVFDGDSGEVDVFA